MTYEVGDPRPSGTEGRVGDTREAGESGPAGDPRPAGEEATPSSAGEDTPTPSSSPEADPSGSDEDPTPTDPYDPTDHTVDEVNAYLDSADADEVERVIAAERSGKNRIGIVGE